jgi:acetyl-CoA C-acetyltransferase
MLEPETVPVQVGGVAVTEDELPWRDITAESLSAMDSFIGQDCTVTVANQTGLTDGAAAVMICDRQFADERGMTPLAEVIGWSTVGSEPARATSATITATQRALDAVGIGVADVDLFELHDSYASIGIAYERTLDIDRDRMNVYGGGLALGHPYAASGTRVAGTLINALQRRGGGVGLGAIVSAGGLGTAVVLNVLAPAA